MIGLVRFQGASLREARVAHVAGVRLLPGVGPLVNLETLLGGQRLVANVALEGFLACVRADVDAQAAHLGEALPTQVTLVRLLSGVQNFIATVFTKLAGLLLTVHLKITEK